MQYLEKQFYMVENLLSYKTRVDSCELSDMISYAERNLDALELEVTGNTILNIFEVINEEKRKIFGVEILFPVDKPFASKGQCVYKPVFRLVNAVSSRFYGRCHNLPEIGNEMLAYIENNNMKPATAVYYILQRNMNLNNNNTFFDAYVAVNGNIV